MSPRRSSTRPRITVTHDDDGGLTLHDPQSDLVVSVIATHPDANGPHGLFIEVYAYRGGPVPWQDATRPTDTGWDPAANGRQGATPHPTFAFYAAKEG